MGERGEGSKLWPPFSVTREPCSSLTGVESKDIDSVLFPFCPSGTSVLTEWEYCVFLHLTIMEYISEPAKDLFV